MLATIAASLPDGRKVSFPMGTSVGTMLASTMEFTLPLVAAVKDNELVPLSYIPNRDITLEPVDTASNEGMRIYQRSLCFVLVTAVRELYPTARLVIDHSVPNGGFYCELMHSKPLSERDLASIETRMREIIALDEPITCEMLSQHDAREVFARQGFQDKVALLEYNPTATVPVYTLRGICDSFYGLLTAHTGQLQWFSLRPSSSGFILFVPQPHTPTELPPEYEHNKIMRVFHEYGEWLRILNLQDISSLNRAVDQNNIREVILISEAFHEKHISQLADEITTKRNVRIVLIAGPSSSGKTTFARRLSIQLRVNGTKPYALGLDDYFVDREFTPRDKNGEYNYEAFAALDAGLFNDQIKGLIEGKEVVLRHYDFISGRGYMGKPVLLPRDAILIIEGIHGLNPSLLSKEVRAQTFSIYASALTQLNIDDHNRVPTSDSRLLRRIVRDSQFRGYTAQDTLARWASVRRGEEQHIFPFQENADAMFNSALAYELAVLKPLAEPLLNALPSSNPNYREARRLLDLLQWVRPCSADYVPDNSLLREFIGGSILEDFSFILPET